MRQNDLRRRWFGNGFGFIRALAAVVAFAANGAGAAAQVPAGAWPGAAVARVLLDGAGPCSGVLVEPRRVLTVGHCVASKRPWRAVDASRLRVVLDGREHRVEAVHVAAGSPFADDGRLREVGNDGAWLRLAARPGVRPVAYGGGEAARRAFITGEPVAKIGFAGGSLQRDEGCTVTGVRLPAGPGGVFGFDCAGGAGQGRSGSALVMRARAGFVVLGVQSAEARGAAVTQGLAVAPPAP